MIKNTSEQMTSRTRALKHNTFVQLRADGHVKCDRKRKIFLLCIQCFIIDDRIEKRVN